PVATGAVVALPPPQALRTMASAPVRPANRRVCECILAPPCSGPARSLAPLVAPTATAAGDGLPSVDRRVRALAGDDALDVLAGSTPPDVAARELHRRAVRDERHAFDEERRPAGRHLQQARLSRMQQHRLERLARPDDPGAVAVREDLVERAALEVLRQQA